MIGPTDDELLDSTSDDEQELNRIAKPGAATPALKLPGLGPIAKPTGSTEDLEARGLASRVTPIAKPAASPGTTEDLENRGISSHIAPMTAAQPSPLEQRTAKDQAEYERKLSTGSGISQIKNPFARYALRGLETVGNIFVPRTTSMIPGTEGHHNILLGQDRGRISGDLEEQKAIDESAHSAAQTEQEQAAAEKDRAAAAAAGAPKPKEETWKDYPMFTDADNTPLKIEQNSGQVLRVDGKPPTSFKLAKEPNENEKEKDIKDYLAAHKLEDTPANRETARDAIGKRDKPEPGNFLPLYNDKGQVTGAWDAKSGRVVAAPQLPGTTGQGAGINARAAAEQEKKAAPFHSAITEAEEAKTLKDAADKGNAEADVALALTFFKVMRGAAGPGGAAGGIRFTQQENNLIMGARNLWGSLEVKGNKLFSNGEPLSATQRQQIMDVISIYEQAAQKQLDALQNGGAGGNTPPNTNQTKPKAGDDLGPAPQGKAEGSTGKLDDGISIVVKGGHIIVQ